MDTSEIDALIATSRRSGFTADPSQIVTKLTEAIASTDNPAQLGQLLLARAVAIQGAIEVERAAKDAADSVTHFRDAGDTAGATFALACAAGMVHRAGDTAAAINFAVEALVLLPQGDLDDLDLVRAANGLGLLFAQMSTFDLAISLSRRAFEGAAHVLDPTVRSIVAYTLGYCAVESIRTGGLDDATRAAYEADLDTVIDWLTSENSDPLHRGIIGSGLRAERTLLRSLDAPPTEVASFATERSDLVANLVLLDQAELLYDQVSPRLVAWHRLVTASVLRQAEQLERALVRLDASVPELIAISDEHRIVRALNERSIVRALAGDLPGALDDARDIARRSRAWQQNQGARLGAQIGHRAELERARMQLRRRADDLAKQASEDPVTGLATRRWLEMHLDELAREELSHDGEAEGVVVVLDLDRFKSINDDFGHQTGDVVLKKVGQAMRGVLRQDTPIARYGGEEFVLIAPGVDHETGMVLAQRLRSAVADVDWAEVAPELRVTISAGVAHGPLAGARELMRLADTALYEAKRAGRDRVVGL